MSGDAAHVDDGTLVRLVDGEGSLRERVRVRWHVRRCAACRARRDDMARRMARLDVLLAVDGDARVPGAASASAETAGRAPRVSRAVAAALVLGTSVVAFGAIVPRLRAWRREAPPTLARTPAVGSTERDAATGREGTTTRVRFVPEAGTLTLTLSTTPSTGTLVIVRHDSTAAAELALSAPQRPRELLLVPDGVRVDVERGRLDGTLHVPPRVQIVRIRIGDEPRRAARVVDVTQWLTGVAHALSWAPPTQH